MYDFGGQQASALNVVYWDSFSYRFKGYYQDEVIFRRPVSLRQIRILRNSNNPYPHIKNSTRYGGLAVTFCIV